MGKQQYARPVDREKLKDYSSIVFGALGGAMTAAMVHLGDRLGLFREMASGEPVSSQELAERTGLHERWLREWLYQQGSAGVLEYAGDDHFSLSAEGSAVLAQESHPAFGAGMFSSFPQTIGVTTRLPEAFRTGVGLPYDAFGPEGAHGIERGFAPWFRSLLVPVALPRLDGVVPALEAGARVADIGCGGGVALLEMARAYPNSEFHGYDISAHALERAETNRTESGVENAEFHDATQDPLPGDASFHFVTTFDVLHDMTDPASAMRSVRAALRDDGAWLICDIKARDGYEENVARNPMVALMYGMSVVSCMSSALSEPGGAGLGTLGLHEELAREMTKDAGFSSFETLDFDHPVNAFYLARP